MTWSAICFFDSGGRSLIRHKYRTDISNKECDLIIRHISTERSSSDEPIAFYCNASSIYIQKNGIFLCLITKKNSNCITGFSFLSNIHQLVKSYIDEFSVSEIKENSILIREILEEAMDFGYPQITDAKIMKQYISDSMKSVPTYKAPGPPAAVTNAVSFRADNISYVRNEVFIDVVEELNFKMNSNGNVTQSEIIGSIILRVYLSGMPELKMMINNKLPLVDIQGLENPIENRDIKFHQCVTQKAQGGRNTLTFKPPDGKFALLNYRIQCDLEPMFNTQLSFISNSSMSITYNLILRTQFPGNMTADSVVLRIPVAVELDSPEFIKSFGSAKYQPEDDVVVWKMSKVKSSQIFHLNATFKRSPDSSKPDVGVQASVNDNPKSQLKPIEIQFAIPFISMSGMQILSLDVYERSQYTTEKFVSYSSRNGKIFQY